MPSAMRQSGPRPALRHLAPAATAPASRGLPAAAQRVGKVSASLPLVCEGGRCCGVLTASASRDGCQMWITKGLPEQGTEAAPESFLSWQCSAGLGTAGARAQQWKSRWVVFHWFGAHLYTSATLPLQKGSAGYGYCFQSRAAKYISFQ